jgi:hypothetical protein
MLSIKTYVVIFVSAWLIIILVSIAGSAVQSSGAVKDPGLMKLIGLYIKGIFFTSFLIQAFCLLPLVLKLFIFMQIKIGNGGHVLVRALIEHEKAVVYCYWTIWLLGLAVAIPVSIKSGFWD